MNKQQQQALRRRLKAERKLATNAALALVDSPAPGVGADIVFELGRVAEMDKRLAELDKGATVRVVEPDLYSPGSPFSFFTDLAASISPMPVRGVDARGAADRLARHSRAEETRRAGQANAQRRRLSALGIEARTAQDLGQERALSSVVPGSGGVFLPPKWILDEFASTARASAPLTRVVTSLPLPEDTLEIHVPGFTATAGVVPETLDNLEPADEYSTTDAIVSPVRSFVANALMSQQIYDRAPGFERIVQRDLTEAFAASLESQMISGSGASGQLLGLLNVPGINTVTWTSTAPTPSAFVTNCGLTASAVANARLRAPSHLIMRPGRFFWSAAMTDGSGNEPVMRPGTGLVAADSDTGPVGPIAGLPVLLDATVPSDLGAGTNQDVALAVRAADCLLLQAEPMFQAVIEQGAAQLEVAIVMHVYVAFVSARYPTGIATLTGSGMTVAAGW